MCSIRVELSTQVHLARISRERAEGFDRGEQAIASIAMGRLIQINAGSD
jgi:hypothetical protein